MDHWIVARTKARRERWAAENITRQGGTFYLPQIYVRPVAGKRLPPVFVFPGYIFVQTDNGRWRYLLGTFGITSIVMQGNDPAVMPASDIARLRAREGADGFIHLPSDPGTRFTHGDHVRVTEGAFSGLRGIYQGTSAQDRVMILLDYLGGKRRVFLGEDLLEPAICQTA